MSNESQKYIVLTHQDAMLIYGVLIMSPASSIGGAMQRIRERLQSDTGGDIENIVARLCTAEVCAACNIEGQASYCGVLDAQQQGRRLRRLLERAKGERTLGESTENSR